MRLTDYLSDKIIVILINMASMMALSLYLISTGNYLTNVILILAAWGIILVTYLSVDYIIKRKYFHKIDDTLKNLDKPYLIAEVMDKGNSIYDKIYREIIHTSNKSVIEEIRDLKKSQSEYKEYIESWVHDIKTPLTAINLICENNKNDYTKKIQRETGIIENQVENVLYYARMEQVYKDYMIQSINLKNVVLNSVRRNKLYFIQGKMQVNVEFDDIMVSTDEKWIEFLLNQIFLNAIKYRANENAHIDITTNNQDKNIELIIEDNGIGIPKEDIGRIFEKGFTGSNGRRNIKKENNIKRENSVRKDNPTDYNREKDVRKEDEKEYNVKENDIRKDNSTDYNISKKATGIGLYLCKNLCDKLDIGIRCESEEGRYTRMILIFPDSDYAKL